MEKADLEEESWPFERSRGLPFGWFMPSPPPLDPADLEAPTYHFTALDFMADSPAAASNSNGAPTPPSAGGGGSKQHRRTYQACMACRDRKVKCNLGHPDNPEPPCARCKRESKHCYFSNTRRKNFKNAESSVVEEEARPVKRQKTGNLPSTLPDATGSVPPRPRTPGGSESLAQPLRPREQGGLVGDMEDDAAVTEDTAEVLQKTEIHHGPDALGLLSTVALAAHGGYRGRTQSSGSLPLAAFNKDTSAIHPSLIAASSPKQSLDPSRGASVNSPFGESKPSAGDAKSIEDSLQAWSKMRFVRAGIFTVQEGMDYLNYFYQYLNPLTPVTVPRFQDPSTHAKLLNEEPILAVTMLTIASRYMQPKGPGATSRSYRIHDALWAFLSQQIERLILGQEQFGGGFCGAGSKKRMGVDMHRGLRTLGTVESLMLLTEWHARALHFPPGADSEELLVGDASPRGTPDGGEDSNTGRIDGWLEPCWRSDRMVWSLLSLAQSLAAELGVFESNSTAPVSYKDHALVEEYLRRKENARRLLYIYITQTSGRLNLPSIIPPSLCQNLFPSGPPLIGKAQPRRSSTGSIPHYQIQETVLYFWFRIAQLFADGNAKLFPNRETTRAIISSGQYSSLLSEYENSAQQWQREFQACTVIPLHMRHILTIEFEYALIYVNSIGLQAVINRCASKAESGVIAPGTLLEMLQGDRIYLEAIIKSSQKFLRAVVDGLLPEKYLKHSPVRTYLRIISVSMMLLKAFALGATGTEVSDSLNLMDRATRALRDCVVDDVHIGAGVAELIGVLTNRARSRMIRIKASTDKKQKSAAHSAATGQQARVVQQASKSLHADNRNSHGPASPWNATNNHARPRHYSQGQQSNATFQSSSPFDISPQNQYTSPLYDHAPNMSIMPPSTWTPDGFFAGGATNDQNGANDYSSNTGSGGVPGNNHFDHYGMDFTQPGAEWAALPLNNIFQGHESEEFAQTGYGLELGGRDMLDVLLMDDAMGGHGAG